MRTVVSADIGGTNTRFILSELTGKTTDSYDSKILYAQKYRNEDYPSFSDVFKQFLFQDAKVQLTNLPLSACFAVAGPVKDNTVIFTNRVSWSIDGDRIAKEFNIPQVQLINDFLGQGYGLLTLKEDVECVCLQPNEKKTTAPIACIGAGTGLGECFLTPANGSYSCFASEGGHAEFAPRNDLEVELLQYLKHKFEQKHRISVERVVSGPGLANIYEFLSMKFPEKVDQDVHKRILEAGEMKGAIIAANTFNALCKQTMEIFAAAYGAEAGVAALKWMPFGGLYLTGGLTPKNINWIRDPDGPFLQAFFDKGRVSGFLKSIPLYAVLVEDLGERGAQYFAIGLTQPKVILATPATGATNISSANSSHAWYSFALTALAGAAVGFALAKRF